MTKYYKLVYKNEMIGVYDTSDFDNVYKVLDVMNKIKLKPYSYGTDTKSSYQIEEIEKEEYDRYIMLEELNK